jgi:DNA-binding MarR family transcriptional regulator
MPNIGLRAILASMSVDDFLEGFDELARAVRRARGATAAGNGHSLTLSQYALLQPLASGGVRRTGELASEAGITPSTATRIVDVLHRRGIVIREPDGADRRAVAIKLTPEGAQALAGQQEWMRSRQRAFYAALDQEEQEIAADLLRRIAALIDSLAAG